MFESRSSTEEVPTAIFDSREPFREWLGAGLGSPGPDDAAAGLGDGVLPVAGALPPPT
jgi:hypothetical protein